ncbi:MAG: UDP-N-acetylmuramate--L-alanine ligase [Verrucomicrobia bacterium]|nr:UDP-N-acetylmuramate--L-alanine ligase [Verrucomicrobiota bacterium]
MEEKTHFIGIGGIGMSALARILLEQGKRVSGSDISSSPLIEKLEARGAEIHFGHSSDHVQGVTSVICSTDIKEDNPELQEAKRLGLPILHRSQLLSQLMEGKQPLLVTGTHGKTTTSSFLAHVLVRAGTHPSFAVGGMIQSLGVNGGFGSGDYFVAEADESDGSFLAYTPYGAIITNIDNDHLDYWKDAESLRQGFLQFAKQIQSTRHLFWCGDDETLSSLHLKGFSYGFLEKNALCITDFRQDHWKTYFDLSFLGTRYDEIEIPLIGAHNVLNAAAVFGLCMQLSLPEESIREGFRTFRGVSRRAEWKGEERSIAVFDDYAHHPTEIFATLRAFKQCVKDRRLIVAFQPHRYSRTRDCFAEFGPALHYADELILTDIYAAREKPLDGITIENLISKIQETTGKEVHYVPRGELSTYLAGKLKPHDVLLTMGAGDITHVGPEVLKRLNPSSQ